jgi:hypothetical protein
MLSLFLTAAFCLIVCFEWWKKTLFIGEVGLDFTPWHDMIASCQDASQSFIVLR